MTKPRKQNIFNTIGATLKFITFWIVVAIQLPIIFILPGKYCVHYMRFFMRILMAIVGLRIKTYGKLDKSRPLMVVCNHISVFEMSTFPVAFGGSFFGKKDIESYPVVGYIAKKFGVIFVSRNSRDAKSVNKQFTDILSRVDYPMFVFPEGTTNNGNFVYPFKSAMFNFIEDLDDKVKLTIQPAVMHYRYKNGDIITADVLADDYSLPDNKKIAKYNSDYNKNEKLVKRERSVFGQVFHIMALGGFLTEVTVLPPENVTGMDRKEIAEHLHKIVSDKYTELKDKKR